MPKSSPKPTRIRFVKAYWVTGQILLRYFNLVWMTKILGKSRMETSWQKAHLKTAQQIKNNILQLKGLFIKVGQMLSIMTHFLPPAITEELEGLQDAVPPAPFSEIERRFIEEFQG